MARVTVEDCLANVDSRFTLVHLAVRRVLQLRHGAPPMLENVKGNKEVVLALREIAAGTINADNIRQIEETRPLPAEPAPPEADAARADLQEILDEVDVRTALLSNLDPRIGISRKISRRRALRRSRIGG